MATGVAVVKALAAQRMFGARGQGIVWAVLDSGVDPSHPHFHHHDNLGGELTGLHRDFTAPTTRADGAPVEDRDPALTDQQGHGTWLAGILGGGLPADATVEDYAYYRGFFDVSGLEARQYELSRELAPEELSGAAPAVGIVSLKVLDDQGRGSSASMLAALEYVRRDLNADGLRLRVHGVLLGVGLPYDRQRFRCGQSPACIEVERLVRSGVVVVTAAGNTGAGYMTTLGANTMAGMSVSINDPGNAESAITVGSTTMSPHRDGVSYFSSKGPTEDGRLKPDLVAPGEGVIGPAAGRSAEQLMRRWGPAGSPGIYYEDSGTAAAAALVSGAVACFLSVHREFVGRPEEVKRIMMATATTLGRAAEFQGKGVVDVMRALQHV